MGSFGKLGSDAGSCIVCPEMDASGVTEIMDSYRIRGPKADFPNDNTINWQIRMAPSVYDKFEQSSGGISAGSVPPKLGTSLGIVRFKAIYDFLGIEHPENFDPFNHPDFGDFSPPYQSDALGIENGVLTEGFRNAQFAFCREGKGIDENQAPVLWFAYAHEDRAASFHARVDLGDGGGTNYYTWTILTRNTEVGTPYLPSAQTNTLATGRNAIITCGEPNPTRTFRRVNVSEDSEYWSSDKINLCFNASPADTPDKFTLVVACYDRAPYCLAYKYNTGELARVYWDQNISFDGTIPDSSGMIEEIIGTLPGRRQRVFFGYRRQGCRDVCLVNERLIQGVYWRGTHWFDSHGSPKYNEVLEEDIATTTLAQQYAPTFMDIGPDDELTYGSNYQIRRLNCRPWSVRSTRQFGATQQSFFYGSNYGWYSIRGFFEELNAATLYNGFRRGGDLQLYDIFLSDIFFKGPSEEFNRDFTLDEGGNTSTALWMLSRDGNTLVPHRHIAPDDIGWDTYLGRLPPMRAGLFDYTIKDNQGPASADPPPGQGYWQSDLYRNGQIESVYDWPVASYEALNYIYGGKIQGPDKAI